MTTTLYYSYFKTRKSLPDTSVFLLIKVVMKLEPIADQCDYIDLVRKDCKPTWNTGLTVYQYPILSSQPTMK